MKYLHVYRRLRGKIKPLQKLRKRNVHCSREGKKRQWRETRGRGQQAGPAQPGQGGEPWGSVVRGLGAQKRLVGPISLALCTPTRPPGPRERAPVCQDTSSKTFKNLISLQMLLLNIPCKPQGGASSGPESSGVPVKDMLSYAPQGRCDPQQPGHARSLGDPPPE